MSAHSTVRVDLHLIVEDDDAGTIDIQLHSGVRSRHLDCLRVAYEEVGGEAVSSQRRRTRHTIDPRAVAEIQALLPHDRLPTLPASAVGPHGPLFTLTIGNGRDAIEYTWTSPAPGEWTRLERITRILLDCAQVDDNLLV